MHQSMSRSPPLDFSEANKIAPLKIPISMLEFPHGRFWGASVKDVTHFFGERLISRGDSTVGVLTFMKAIHVQLAYKRRDICMFEVLSVNL
jgi:hypothetical protein